MGEKNMAANVLERVKKHRTNLRSLGLRPVQIWVADTRQPNFAQECLQQSKIVVISDKEDKEMLDFIDTALSDVEGWLE
jgi:Protein  of unknown function (DUF3018)